MTRARPPGSWDPQHGWLPAVVPADARRFRTTHPALRGELLDIGAELVESRPDVEICPPHRVRGDATCAVVPLTAPPGEGATLLVRGARRLAGHARVQISAEAGRRLVLRRGYGTVTVRNWDRRTQPVFPPDDGSLGERLRALRRLTLSAVVVGHAGAPPRTLLDEARAAAGSATSLRFDSGPLVAASGVIIVMTREGVLRVAACPAVRLIDDQLAALDALRRAGAGDVVVRRAPWPLASGAAGLARWSVERRLRGGAPDPKLDEPLRRESLDFLVGLAGANQDRGPRTSPADDGDVIAAACPAPLADAMRHLGRRLGSDLAGVPRVFAHGDFWSANLLADGGHLVGVVDWASAGPGGLPLADLLHLWLNAERERAAEDLGEAFVGRLLPMLRSGGNDLVRAYCARVGIRPAPDVLERLGIAYWLSTVASDLRSYADRRGRPHWLEQNVHLVARALARSRLAS